MLSMRRRGKAQNWYIRGSVTLGDPSVDVSVKHGLKYAFPAKPGAPQRGVATGFAAPMLKGQLVSSGADIHVWPYAEGSQRGSTITPLFKSVPEAALKDERLYELLALVDAIRLGNQREANLAQDRFEERMARA